MITIVGNEVEKEKRLFLLERVVDFHLARSLEHVVG